MQTKEKPEDRPLSDELPVAIFLKRETVARIEKLAVALHKESDALISDILEQEISWVELDSEDYAKIAREMKDEDGKKG